jgi:hypothetical protein
MRKGPGVKPGPFLGSSSSILIDSVELIRQVQEQNNGFVM